MRVLLIALLAAISYAQTVTKDDDVWTCENGERIRKEFVCDKKPDCEDLTDEIFHVCCAYIGREYSKKCHTLQPSRKQKRRFTRNSIEAEEDKWPFKMLEVFKLMKDIENIKRNKATRTSQSSEKKEKREFSKRTMYNIDERRKSFNTLEVSEMLDSLIVKMQKQQEETMTQFLVIQGTLYIFFTTLAIVIIKYTERGVKSTSSDETQTIKNNRWQKKKLA